MADGISLFAIFYILAQAIERIVELISESESSWLFLIPMFILSRHRSQDETENFCEEKREIDECDRKIKDWQNIIDKSIDKLIDKIPSDSDLQNTIKKYQQKIDTAENKKNEEEMKRIVGLWFWASVSGIILCFIFKIGFLNIIKPDLPSAGGLLDYAISGIVIGSGTKPLHDIIAYIEKAS